MTSFQGPRLALIAHRDMTVVSALQHAFNSRGYASIIARDLPTALLAITQHHFDAAIVGASLPENGDGFPLAGIIQRIFPEAAVSVITKSVDVPDLLAAINNGVRKLVDVHSGDAEFLVISTLTQRASQPI